MAKGITINVLRSFDDLKDEVDYDKFKHKDDFELICRLIPNVSQEKLEIEYIDEELTKRAGLVYVFVIKNKIFKVGESINSIKDRVQSYNCGKVNYRINGTCSTTNYYVLQSLLKINEPVDVYAFFPEEPEYEIFGVKYKNSRPPSKVAENVIINEFVDEYHKKPIGCTQE